MVEIEPTHLVRLREKDRQSKTQLAKAAGISLGYLADLESGRRKGNPAVIGKLADALNVPTSMLERRHCTPAMAS
ncbi:MAG: family transcriptional regulator [Frankiales bacterium]|nr:family transcriptional regulator [Frankiales bacterium]